MSEASPNKVNFLNGGSSSDDGGNQAQDAQKEQAREAPPTIQLVEVDPWDPIVPIDREAELPPFPIEHLRPLEIRQFAEDLCETIDIEADVTGPVLIGVASIPALGRYSYDIGQHIEYAPLWICSEALSADRKSPIVRKAMDPVREWERHETERLRPELARQIERREIQRARLKKLRNTAATAKEHDRRHAAREEAEQLATEIDDAIPRFGLLGQDVTPEAMPKILAEHQGRLVLSSAEGGLLATIAGRYMSGLPNVDAFCQAYSCEQIFVDRVGRPHVAVEQPNLTIILTVQPVVLEALQSATYLRQTGYLPRFLFAKAKSRVGKRKYRYQGEDSPEARASRTIEAGYRALILAAMGEASLAPPQPLRPIPLSKDARELWIHFHDGVESELGDGGRLESIADWGGKAAGQVARIAGAFHALEHAGKDPTTVPIRGETMASAIVLGQYFTEHALATFESIGATPEDELALWILRWIQRHGLKAFCTSKVREHKRGPTKDQIEAALRKLADRNYVRELPPGKPGQRGRPSDGRWEVHPDVFRKAPRSGNSEKSGNPPSTNRSTDFLNSMNTPGASREVAVPTSESLEKRLRRAAREAGGAS